MIAALLSTDHKVVAIRAGIDSALFFVGAGVLALLIRSELAQAGLQVVSRAGYTQLFTMHGSTMIFLVVIPLALAACLYLVPLQIGTTRVCGQRWAFAGQWLIAFAGVVMWAGWLTREGAGRAGWTAYDPLARTPQTPGPGMDLWICGAIMATLGAILIAACVLATILRRRVPGMTMLRLPVFSWTALASCLLVVFAFPSLVVAFGLLLAERRGMEILDPIAYQHLFWFYGHPAVYVMFFPFVGMVAEAASTFSERRFFGYRAFVLALLGFTALSMSASAHHMFTTGAVPHLRGNRLRARPAARAAARRRGCDLHSGGGRDASGRRATPGGGGRNAGPAAAQLGGYARRHRGRHARVRRRAHRRASAAVARQRLDRHRRGRARARAARAAPPARRRRSVMTTITADPVALATPAAGALALVLIARRHPRWPARRTMAGVGGLAVLAVASMLEGAAGERLSMHMLQHTLIGLVAAPLLVAAAPVRLAHGTLSPRARRRLARELHRPALRAFVHPLAGLSIFVATLALVHAPPFYDAALRHPLLHAGEHALLLWSAIALWVPIVGADPLPRRAGPVARVGVLIGAMTAMSALGAALAGLPHVAYLAYATRGGDALRDQALAGGIMWVGGMAIVLPALLRLAWSALWAEERAQQACERRAGVAP
jgi:cytochrome c oxidase assembly factor CtaG